MRANRPRPEPKMGRDLFKRKVFVVAQPEDHLLLRGESTFGAGNRGAQLRCEKLPLGIRAVVDRLDRQLLASVITLLEETEETAAAQKVARLVDRDARQPRLESRALLE